ncbi:protein kintoun [Odontesthes bonariensis]|uniref:protein kintoun n=1 Tax=Odontesthes bonariensis TaxID=219752 RepID=UPI003F585762
MELGDEMKDLNLTADEIDKFARAFKDDKFREMLHDYAQEISDPENRKKYEEEIKLLEQERGNRIEFIHPTPFRVIKTSVGGKQKCFVNICSNDKVGRPESKCAVGEDGRRGQSWSLPHTLFPGRQDTDPKGKKFMIYDVIYHPETLYIASKNKRFMDMVDDTAIQGIQRAFKVTLDKNNVREMRTKYKGTPQPSVIRKPIPGCEAKEAPEQPDPLAFPYPDEKRLQTKPAETKNNSDVELESPRTQPRKTKEPTKPNYAVKYRSFIDLQDFRCSRDSAQSPRPKEIVVTIDMPLLKSVTNTNLEVNEKSLLLESENPAYRLELPLAYPVNEDEGEAKFNKQKGQLTVTLPVRPPHEAFDIFVGPATPVGDFQRDSERLEERIEGRHTAEQETRGENCEEEEGERDQEKGEEQSLKGGEEVEKEKEQLERKRQESEEEESQAAKQRNHRTPQREEQEKEESQEREEAQKEVLQLTMWDEQSKSDEISHHNELQEDRYDRAAEKLESGEPSVLKTGTSAGEETTVADKHILIYDRLSSHKAGDEDESLTSAVESTPKTKSPDIQEETAKTKTGRGIEQVGTDAALQNPTFREESQTSFAASTTLSQSGDGADVCISDEVVKSGDTKTSGGDSDRQLTPRSAESVKQREDTDEDDLPAEQIFQISEHDEPAPALLREIDTDGNETVIRDHSTAAGFIFQNKLMYELD